jgi:hypothetical protein
MMQACEFCPEWAQWRMLWVEPQAKELVTTAKIPHADGTLAEKKLHPRGLQFSHGPFLCGAHKQQMELTPSELERRFVFTGGAPSR